MGLDSDLDLGQCITIIAEEAEVGGAWGTSSALVLVHLPPDVGIAEVHQDLSLDVQAFSIITHSL
jgi:hypothetical protein